MTHSDIKAPGFSKLSIQTGYIFLNTWYCDKPSFSEMSSSFLNFFTFFGTLCIHLTLVDGKFLFQKSRKNNVRHSINTFPQLSVNDDTEIWPLYDNLHQKSAGIGNRMKHSVSGIWIFVPIVPQLD